MKIPEALAELHRVVSAMSQLDLNKTCIELTERRAINLNDAKEVLSALNAFKSFFGKIARHNDLN